MNQIFVCFNLANSKGTSCFGWCLIRVRAVLGINCLGYGLSKIPISHHQIFRDLQNWGYEYKYSLTSWLQLDCFIAVFNATTANFLIIYPQISTGHIFSTELSPTTTTETLTLLCQSPTASSDAWPHLDATLWAISRHLAPASSTTSPGSRQLSTGSRSMVQITMSFTSHHSVNVLWPCAMVTLCINSFLRGESISYW